MEDQAGLNSSPTLLLAPDTESIEVQAIDQGFRKSPKFSLWVNYFLDKDNQFGLNTFGNQTQAAIHAYNLDTVSQYQSAAVIGHENLKKLKSVASAYLTKKGLTFGTMLDIAAAKMAKSTNPQWWMIVAEMMGIIEPQGKLNSTQTTQINISANTVISKEEQDQWDKDFLKFLETRRA